MPGKLSDSYHANAIREREYAAEATLAHVVALHLRSADKWDQLAAQAARVETAREQ